MGYRPGRRVGAGREPGHGLALLLTLVALGLAVVLLGAAWLTGAADFAVWWLTNTTPPAVAVEAPSGPVRGVVSLAVRVGPEGRARPVDASVDGRPLPADLSVPVDTTTLPDGTHQVTVVAEDHSWRRNRAATTATLVTDNTPPRLALDLVPTRVLQGHTWLLRIRTDEPASVEARLGDRPLEVEAGDGFGWAVLGFGPTAEVKTAPVVVDGRDPAGNQAQVSQPLEVVPDPFPRDEVDVPTELGRLLASDIRTEEDRQLAAVYQPVTRPRLWEGQFLMPVSGPIITEFGTLRSYNGGPVVGHHGGVDIVAPAGRQIVAPARGKVVLVDEVRLRGKIVVLDHGLGVYTTYAHLSSADVQVGQIVERGQPFAKVGSTGLSTGPHLHWELWVGGANVDPLEWTERTIP